MVKVKLFDYQKSFDLKIKKNFFVKKIEDGIILLPKNDKSVWDNMFDRLDKFSDDFVQERVQPAQNREDLF